MVDVNDYGTLGESSPDLAVQMRARLAVNLKVMDTLDLIHKDAPNYFGIWCDRGPSKGFWMREEDHHSIPLAFTNPAPLFARLTNGNYFPELNPRVALMPKEGGPPTVFLDPPTPETGK